MIIPENCAVFYWSKLTEHSLHFFLAQLLAHHSNEDFPLCNIYKSFFKLKIYCLFSFKTQTKQNKLCTEQTFSFRKKSFIEIVIQLWTNPKRIHNLFLFLFLKLGWSVWEAWGIYPRVFFNSIFSVLLLIGER